MNENLLSSVEKLKQFPIDSKIKFKQVLAELANKKLGEELFHIVDSMSEDEYQVFIEILREAAVDGESTTYTGIKFEDYEEIPVDIYTFITDPDYLGIATKGGTQIFPYWIDVLKKIFAPDSQILEVVLTGAIGIGKSTIAVIGMAYILYKLLCLKNPAQYYNLLEGSQIAEAIFNIDLQHVHGIGYSRLQSMLKRSPWFIRHGNLRGRNAMAVRMRLANGDDVDQESIDELTYEPGKNISLLVGSKQSHFTGYDVFCAFLDEMNFYEKGNRSSDSSETFTSLEIMKVYTAIKRRMESRFMIQGVVPGLIFMISSKKSQNDALEAYAEKYRHDPTVLVVDEPQWVVKQAKGQYSGVKFKLLVGDKYNKTRILAKDEDASVFEEAGRRVLEVPIEHRRAFELDADQALTDIAGIALVSGSRFIDALKYRDCISTTRANMFIVDVLKSGLNTSDMLSSFVDLRRIPEALRHLQVYIHLDTSKNKDRTGIGVVARSIEYSDVDRLEQGTVVRVRDYSYYILGVLGVEAPPGDMIPYRKLLELIIYLRNAGLNISGVSTDSYQSVFLQQELIQNGFNTTVVSVDKTPVAYLSLRKSVYEKRIESVANRLLEHEITELLEDKQTRKIDHPIEGSKDLADSITGAFYHASISQLKTISAGELARIQESAFDEQLTGADGFPEEFNGRKIRKPTSIFAEIDRMMSEDDFDF